MHRWSDGDYPVGQDAKLKRAPDFNPVGGAGFDPGVFDIWISPTSRRRLPRAPFRKERASLIGIQQTQGIGSDASSNADGVACRKLRF